MNIFEDVTVHFGDTLRDQVVLCAHSVGLVSLLCGGAYALNVICKRLALATRPTRMVLDVLCFEALVVRDVEGRYAWVGPRTPPPSPVLPLAGWGALETLLIHGNPVALDEGVQSLEGLKRYHTHLQHVGRSDAEAWANTLPRESHTLLDIGGGTGTYTAAFLASSPTRRALLLDRADVLDLARDALSSWGDRVVVAEWDLLSHPLPTFPFEIDVALVANVLHLHSPTTCAALAVTLTASLSTHGGRLDFVDLGVDEERTGPRSALYFALNMALYTQGGDVYTPSHMCSWLRDAGCSEISVQRLGDRVGSAWCISGNAPQQTLQTEKEE